VQKLNQTEKRPAKQEPELTDECEKCGKISGYHCLNCHSTVEDLKDQKLLKQHNAKCAEPLWLNPLSEKE